MSESSVSPANAAASRRSAGDWSLFGLALVVTAIWGFNFVVIKVGTDDVPPLLLAALRFVFVALPAVFFVRRPRAPWLLVAGYGLFLGVGEFGLLFAAIKLGAPVGLSSLILQSQAFFTALLASLFLAERFTLRSAIGMLVAALGLALIGVQQDRPGAWGGHFALALAMLIAAAAMWAVANILARRIGNVGSLNLLIWSSLVSPAPLLLLSFFIDGPRAMLGALRALSWLSVGALVYLVVLSTLVGYGTWNHLIVKHGAGKVAPFSMLVPIFGISSGALFLGERFTAFHAVAATLVVAGLALHALGRRAVGAR
ncbi:MAG TPA: EamA family transporter [Polyangiaceae bacterium]